jgi:hypothetical protein
MIHKAGVFTLFVVLSMITAGVFASNLADAAKPQPVIDWSNGFPSGDHSTMNIHGKKIGYNCDNSLEGKELYGSSVFVPMFDTSEINIVSNKRSSITEGKAIDPCAEPFGQPGNKNDPALYQLPTGEHQVYWRILGIPNNGNGNNGNDGSSEARITFPTLIDQCDFLPVAFEDGTIVQSFDPDAQAALTLVAFGTLERHTDNGDEFFQNTESIYFDADKTGTVTDGDELLYGLPAADLTPLIEFNESEKHEDNTGTTANVFEFGETIYLDQEILGTVDAGDTRIANAASQGLSEDQGGDAISCEDETLVGLGLVNNKGAFKKTDEGLERFGDESTKGKGKSKAIEITDLFIWSGVVCDASLDTNLDGQLTLDDFIDLTEDDIANAGVVVDGNTMIEPAEFQAYLATLDECTEFTDEWVFNVADIVLYGFTYENNGSSLTQIRFYPTATTEFTE